MSSQAQNQSWFSLAGFQTQPLCKQPENCWTPPPHAQMDVHLSALLLASAICVCNVFGCPHPTCIKFPIMYYSFQSCLYSFSIRNFRSPVFYCFDSTHGTDRDCLLNTYHCRTSNVLTCPQLEEEGEKEESSLPPSIMSSQT